MRIHAMRLHRKLQALVAGGVLAALGGCQFDSITTTATTELDSRDVIISLIRGAIITPLDNLITDRINNVFDNLTDDN